MITSMGSEQIIAKALSLGVASYIIKKPEDTFLKILPLTISRLLNKNNNKVSASEPDDLTTNKDFYESLANFSMVSIFVHVEDKIVFANRAVVTLLDASSLDTLIGIPSLALVPTDQHEKGKKRIKEIEESGEFAPPIEIQVVQVTSRLIDIETRAIVINFKGKPARMMMTQDISEQKKSRMPSTKQ